MLTLAIIKPDAVAGRHTGKIIAHLEAEGFQIREAQMVRLTESRAESFYEVHRERPFFRPLVTFMTSGPALALALEREDAVTHLRKVIGATDPAQAEAGTIRRLFRPSKERHAIHRAAFTRNDARE